MTRDAAETGWLWSRSVRARPLGFAALLGLSAAAVIAAPLVPLFLGEIQTVSLAQDTRGAVSARTTIEGVADVENGARRSAGTRGS